MKKRTLLILFLVLCLSGIHGLSAQDSLVVRGVIRDGSGDPLLSVAVSEEGSTRMPVLTGNDGSYELIVSSERAWIIISPSSSYSQRRIFLAGRTELNLFLSEAGRASGDDPLLVLNQDIRRRDMVTAFSEPRIDKRHHSAAFTVDEHMQGRVAGMYTINRNGDLGSGAVASIRGVRSVYANNQPLYIVDGVPLTTLGLFSSKLAGYQYNALLGVNAFDISAITVTKDPVYGAAYGSKGSNGMVFIETLDPSVTATSIEVDARTGFSLAPDNQIPQLNASQHNTLMNELLFSTGLEEESIREAVPGLFLEPGDPGYIDYQHNTNWQDVVFDDSWFYNLNLKVKGGDEIARYGLSFGYMDGSGVVDETRFNGYNLRFVSLLNIFTWLKMDAVVSLNYNSSLMKEAALLPETSPLMSALAKSPMLNPYQYDPEDNLLKTLANVNDLGVSNPMAVIHNYEATSTNYNFTSMIGAEFTLSRNAFIKSKVSYNYDVVKEQQFLPNLGMELYENTEAHNISKASNNDINAIYNNTYFQYQNNFGTDHALRSQTGVHIQSNTYEYDWGLTKNAHPNDEYRDLQDGQNNLREIGGDNRSWNWVSIYENLSYTFRDKYLLSATVNLDGSSRIGQKAINTLKLGGQPFGLFYSAGVAWRVSNESFLRDLSFMEDFKLRASFGKTGNDDIGESSATDYFQAIKFRETVGLFPALIANDELSYETVSQLNLGADLSLLANRFMFGVDYFVGNTSDMIIFNPIDAYYGYDFRIENGGEIQNKGLELSTFLRVVDGNSFKWDVQAWFSSVSNEVTGIEGNKLVYDIPGGQKVNQEGYAPNSFYGYVYEGVYSSTEDAQNAPVDDRGIAYGPGDARYSDLSGPDGVADGVIDEYDKTIIGSPDPDFFGGITTTLHYKNLSLSASLHYVSGQEVFNYVRYMNERMVDLNNQSGSVLSRWQYDGQQTDVPRAVWDDPQGNSDFSTRWIEDGSFMRLKNITLAYRIPGQFLVFKSAEFYVSANNLLTWTSYLGYDPEFSYSHSQIYQGVDYGMTPHARQFIAGIKIGL